MFLIKDYIYIGSSGASGLSGEKSEERDEWYKGEKGSRKENYDIEKEDEKNMKGIDNNVNVLNR